MEIQDVLLNCISSCYDALEDFFNELIVPTGKVLNEVLIGTLVLLVFSVTTYFLKIPVFITWDEALVAVIMMLIICSVNSVNKAIIESIKNKLFRRGE